MTVFPVVVGEKLTAFVANFANAWWGRITCFQLIPDGPQAKAPASAGYWRSQSNGRENSCIREAFQNYLDAFGIFHAKVLFHRFRVAKI